MKSQQLGFGNINGPNTWIFYNSADIIAHELGHNIGFNHASTGIHIF